MRRSSPSHEEGRELSRQREQHVQRCRGVSGGVSLKNQVLGLKYRRPGDNR